jgi:hypothetical protein
MRGQELSFRGAWFCSEDGCKDHAMARSSESDLEGTTPIQKVTWKGDVALAFTAAAPPEVVTATARDCDGKSTEVGKIAAPGDHRIGKEGARESWMIRLDRAALRDAGLRIDEKGKCSRVLVTAHGKWPDGATYDLAAGVVAD